MIAFVNRFGYNCFNMIPQRRAYRLHKRARTVEETRLRIIEAAYTLLAGEGYHNVSLDEIAARAGVSRQTIYVQFGSKRGVLQAIAEYIERESYGTDMMAGARTVTSAIHTIRNGVRDQIDFFHQNADLLRTFYAQAANDPDFRSVWQDRMRERRDAIHLLVEKLAKQGWLVEDWSVEEATDWLWSLTNFQRYDELVIERGWTSEQLARRLRQAIDMVLLPGGDEAVESAAIEQGGEG